jgi:hypothetical protein
MLVIVFVSFLSVSIAVIPRVFAEEPKSFGRLEGLHDLEVSRDGRVLNLLDVDLLYVEAEQVLQMIQFGIL